MGRYTDILPWPEAGGMRPYSCSSSFEQLASNNARNNSIIFVIFIEFLLYFFTQRKDANASICNCLSVMAVVSLPSNGNQ